MNQRNSISPGGARVVALQSQLTEARPDLFASVGSVLAPVDMAELLDVESDTNVADLLMRLGERERAELFAHFGAERQDRLLPGLPQAATVTLIERLPSDVRADVFNRLGDAEQGRLLLALPKAEREDLLAMAAYPEDSVGSVATSDYATAGAGQTIIEAIGNLRASAAEGAVIDVVFVVDADHRLCGFLTLREIVLAEPGELIGDLMDTQPLAVRADAQRSRAADLIRKYDLLALPVVDGENRMIGIVTVDDAMDVDKEEDAIRLARFGGTGSVGGPDLDLRSSPFRRMFGVRAFWLCLLTIFGVVTSTFVAAQEEIIGEVLILAAFIAPIIDMGGNTGSQSATLVLRGMALGEFSLRWKDLWFVVKREIPVACALAVTVSVLESGLALLSKGSVLGDAWVAVLLVVSLSMLVCTVLGSLIGSLLPFAARRIGTDPATLSAPLLTSIMDFAGVLVYFGFAYLFLGHLLG